MNHLSRLEIKKSILRGKIREVLTRIPAAVLKKKNNIIFSRLIKNKYFNRAECVLLYAALPKEAGTLKIIHASLKRNKTVCLPVADLKNGKMTAWSIKKISDLRRGGFGILEPDAKKSTKQRLSSIDLILVPGLGFDRAGRRLGRGKGYYDRFLRKVKNARRIGLAFKEQLVPRIPTAKHDMRVHQVITD